VTGRQRTALAVATFAVLGTGSWAVAARFRAQARKVVPTTRVRRGDLSIEVVSKGQLLSTRSAMLVVPQVSGSLQIISILPTGTRVKPPDVVIELDPAEQEYRLERARSQLEEVEEEIKKMQAEAAVQASQDKVALLEARFAVRRAELEVGRNELLSAIDVRKNLLALEEAQRRREQLEKDVQSRSASNEASLAVLNARREKERLDRQDALRALDEMKVRTSVAGIVSVRENRDAAGGFFMPGMSLPDYRAGDLVNPGRLLAEVMDVELMEVQIKLEENDRDNVAAGQGRRSTGRAPERGLPGQGQDGG